MKSRIFAVVLLLVCVTGAMVWGAGKGWAGEHAQVEEHLASLQSQLDTRVETAHNILVVARRHMDASDSRLAALESARDVLAGDASLGEKASANAALEEHAQALLSALAALGSVQQDARDKMYVENLLPQMLRESAAYTAQSAYNTAALDFNARFERSVISGFIARLLGMDTFEVFTTQL